MLVAITIVGFAVLLWVLSWGVFQVYNYYFQWKLEESYKKMEKVPIKKRLSIVKK